MLTTHCMEQIKLYLPQSRRQAAVYLGSGIGLYLAYRTTRTMYRLFGYTEYQDPRMSALMVPPEHYHHRTDTGGTQALLAASYPNLLEVADAGSLVVLERPPDYDSVMEAATAQAKARSSPPVSHSAGLGLQLPPDSGAATAGACPALQVQGTKRTWGVAMAPLPHRTFIIGTVHVSRKSADNVYDLITSVAPTGVVVELCPSRAIMLYRDEKGHELRAGTAATSNHCHANQQHTTAAAAAGSRAAAAAAAEGSSLQDGAQAGPGHDSEVRHSAAGAPLRKDEAGLVAAEVRLQQQALPLPQPRAPSKFVALMEGLRSGKGVFEVLLGWAYQDFEEQLGTVAGLEFIKARMAIETLIRANPRAGVTLYFGDVPLQRTLARTWGVLSFWKKLKLTWTMARELLFNKVDEAMIESLMQEDIFDMLKKELEGEYPEVMGPLLYERNWHLADAVRQAAADKRDCVVLVIGKGHLAGVVHALMQPYHNARQAVMPAASTRAARGHQQQAPA